MRLSTFALKAVLACLLTGAVSVRGADLVTSFPVIQGDAFCVSIDSGGNRYVAGTFNSQRDFNPGVGEDVKTPASALSEVFITRFNADGTYAWTQTFGGTAIEFADAIVATDTGIYVGGSFSSTDAKVGGAGANIATRGGFDGFILLLDPATGAPQLSYNTTGVQTFGGSSHDDFLRDLAVTGQSAVAVGEFNSSSFGFTSNLVTNADSLGGVADGYIIKLLANGQPDTSFNSNGVQTVTSMSGSELPFAVTIANNRIYSAGVITGSTTGVGGPGSRATVGSADAYVLSLQLSGVPDTGFSPDGLRTFGGTGADEALGIAATSNRIYVCGRLDSTNAGFNGSLGSFGTSGLADAFIIGFGTDGVVDAALNGGFVRIGGASGADVARRLVVGGTVIYAAGTVASTSASINGGIAATTAGGGDAFVAAIKSDGTADVSFSGDGLEYLGGTFAEEARGIAQKGGILSVVGFLPSTDVPGPGGLPLATANFGGFLLPLNQVNGKQEDFFEPNNVFDLANPPQSASGMSGTLFANDDDFFNVSLTAGNTLTATLNHNSSVTSLNFELYSPTNTLVASSTLLSATSQRLTFTAPTSDVYHIRVAFNVATGRDYTITTSSSNPALAPVITSLVFSQNPARPGLPVTITVNATDPAGTGLTHHVDFGDGSNAMGNPVTHAYAAPGTYMVQATASNTAGSATTTQMLVVEGPNSGGSGVPNIALDDQPVANPLNGLTVSVTSSDGGVVELAINVDAIVRETFDVSTEFIDLPGRGSTVFGTKPVHKYIKAGIYVAKSTATLAATGEEKGKVRKTLPITAAETGETALISAAPASTTFSKFAMKGKFVFDKDVNDEVSFSGTVEMPAGVDLSQEQSVSVAAGNIVDDVMLDTKGRPKSAGSASRIKKMKITYPRLKKGTTTTVAGQLAKFSFTLALKDADLAGFDTEGITNSLAASEAGLKSVPRKIQVALVLAGVAYDGLVDVQYKLSKDTTDGVLSGRGGN